MENTMRIGTIVDGADAAGTIAQIKKYGFESFSLHMGSNVMGRIWNV